MLLTCLPQVCDANLDETLTEQWSLQQYMESEKTGSFQGTSVHLGSMEKNPGVVTIFHAVCVKQRYFA
jgi:hypothetical protein